MTTREQKIQTIKDVAAQFGIKVFVETGTFQGDMIEAVKDQFLTIHSIEIDEELYKAARERFALSHNVCLWHGDSAVVISDIAHAILAPAIFWLDAHSQFGKAYAGNPLLQEIEAIRKLHHGDHVILIDDTDLLGTGDFPTKDKLAVALAGLKTWMKGPVLVACSPNLASLAARPNDWVNSTVNSTTDHDN